MFARIAAACVCSVGVVVLLGWTFDIATFKSVVPDWPRKTPVTALAFVLSGIALACRAAAIPADTADVGPGTRHKLLQVSQACAWLLVWLGGLKLAGYALNLNLGFDPLGFRDVVTPGGSAARMANATAFNFLLIGCALLLAGRPRRTTLFQLLVLLAGLNGILGLSRYVFGGETLLPFQVMAVHTAVAFVMLSAGVLCLQPRGGLLESIMADRLGVSIPLPAAYGLAVVSTAITLLARAGIGDRFEGPTMIMFTVPIIVSAYLGGLGPGLLATLISGLGAAYLVLPPLYSFKVASQTHRWQEALLFVTGGLISLICSLLRRSRQRAEAMVVELQRKESELRGALKDTGDLRTALDEHAIVAVTDSRGKITFVNDKFCAISQYSRAELIGQDHRLINSGFHPREFIRDLWTTIENGQVWHGEIKNRAKDGTFYWVDTTIVPFLDEHGKPRQYVAIRADITDRKQAEEARRSSEARYRTIFEYAPDGIVIADPTGVYLDANGSICQMLGYTRQELIGLPSARIVAEAESSHIEPALGAINTETPYRREWQFRRKDHSLFAAEVIAIRMPDGNLLAMIQDITDRKHAEGKIAQLNAELEQRVAERTAQLEVANKELESFSYSVSHDLRAPLRAVNGFARILLDQYAPQLPAEAREYLDDIRVGGEQMGQLIDDLLAFSRLGRHALKSQPVETAQLVQQVLDELIPQREGRPFEIKVGELPSCQGDPALLKQVWFNLIANAIKYTCGRMPAVIEIGCDPGAPETVFYVRDNGAGFDMRYVHKLFGVFQRLHRADEFEGTGVGLAIVQRIIHRHGGRVWAEAEAGRGAIFRFTLGQEK